MHSTGHNHRLNRSGITEIDAEEFIAEIGAAMLCSVAGIDNSTIDNSVAYIGGWLRKLKSDNKMIIQAAWQSLDIDVLKDEQGA